MQAGSYTRVWKANELLPPLAKHAGGTGAHALVFEPLCVSIQAQEKAEGEDSADLHHKRLAWIMTFALRFVQAAPFYSAG